MSDSSYIFRYSCLFIRIHGGVALSGCFVSLFLKVRPPSAGVTFQALGGFGRVWGGAGFFWRRWVR